MNSEATTYPFAILKRKAIWFAISGLVILSGIAKMAVNNQQTGQALTFGIDFTGGAAYVYKFTNPPAEGDSAGTIRLVRDAIAEVETAGAPKIQVFADGEVQIRTATGSDPDAPIATAQSEAETEADSLLTALRGKFGEVELIQTELVGPVIGEHLRIMAFWALLWGCLGITLYIGLRYNIKGIGAGYLFGVAAVIALVHDAMVIVSVYAWTNTEVNSSFIAAVLTIIGYSVNDTVIIFDRIRENLGRVDTAQRRNLVVVEETVERSLWQTMTRSIVTAVTTLFPLITLYFFGGVTIHDFAFALLIGIISGGYSSIFLAAPIFIAFYRKRLLATEGSLTGPAQRGRPVVRPRTTSSKPLEDPGAMAQDLAKATSKPAATPRETPASETGGSDGAKRKKSGGGGKRKRRY